MTSTKRTPRFTEEEKEVLKELRKIKMQISKEMLKTTYKELYEDMKNVKASSGKKPQKKSGQPNLD